MSAIAAKNDFEQASLLKKQLERLQYITAPRTKPWEYESNPNLVSDRRNEESISLENILGIRPIKKIEGYDISDTSGKLATGAQVTFVDGSPEKSLYRRYKIRQKNADVAMIQEVISRRLKSKIPLPDLVVIDGGKEHLVSTPVPTIGLAKRLETIYFQGKTIQLPANSPALHLLQRLRDEAHRFSRRYHFLLRRKSMLA